MPLTMTVDEVAPLVEGITRDKAQIIVDDAVARARRLAPCLVTTEDPDILATAKAILHDAIERRAAAGPGITTQQTAGPYSQSTETKGSLRLFLPSEEAELRDLCAAGGKTKRAFDVDTAPSGLVEHAPWCNLLWRAGDCSCGGWLTLDGPIYELP